MSVTSNTVSLVRPPTEGDVKFVSAYSADFSGCESLIAAVTAKSHYILKIKAFCQSVTDLTITFGAGETTSACTTILLGPISMPDAGGDMEIDFGPDHALRVTAGTAFTVDMSAASPTAILVWYKTAT